jgi:hypothetical protein
VLVPTAFGLKGTLQYGRLACLRRRVHATVNEKNVKGIAPFCGKKCPRVRRWRKGVWEVLAPQKLVQNERDGELSVFRMPFRLIRVGWVLADAVTTAYCSVTSRHA